MKSIILFSCVLGLVVSESGEFDDEHQHLQNVATNIMQNLQKEHIPSEGSNSGAPNAPIKHLHDSQLISKTDKLKITVGVKGTQFVSVESNGKVVNISTTFGVGSVALYTVNREDTEEIEEYEIYTSEEADKEIDNTLDSMEGEYLSDNLTANKNQTKIIIAKKAKFDIKIKPKTTDKKEVDVTVNQGYVVAAITNVKKGYTDQSLNF